MYLGAAAQQTSPGKAVVFFKVKTRACRLSVIETKPDTENASNWNNFGFPDKKKSKFNERVMFSLPLQNLYLYRNP